MVVIAEEVDLKGRKIGAIVRKLYSRKEGSNGNGRKFNSKPTARPYRDPFNKF